MKRRTESKVFAELRKIRDAIHEEASAVGWRNYYADLHKRAGFFFGSFPKRSARKSYSGTREPSAIREVHEWRRKLRQSQKATVVRERPPKYKPR